MVRPLTPGPSPPEGRGGVTGTMGARMTDEPTPPPIEDGSPEWRKPPGIEQTAVEGVYPRTEVPIPPRPRNPIGWLVSGAMILFLVFGAVAGYVDQPAEETAQTALQNSLKFSVSLDPSGTPALKKAIVQMRNDGLKDVLEKASKRAQESEEAARIAVVAARELNEDAPQEAIEKLSASYDELSQVMSRIYGGEQSAEDVDALVAIESNEFAVELAKTQAQEKMGREVDRSQFVDKGLVLRFGLVMLGGLGAIVGGVICLIAFVAHSSGGKIVPVGFGELHKSDGDRHIARFALCLFVFFGVGLAGKSLYELPAFAGVSELWFQVAVQAVALVVVVALLRLPMLDRSDSLNGIVGEKRPFWKLVRTGVFGYLCTVPLLFVAVLVMTQLIKFLPDPTHPINEDIAVATSLDWLAIALLATLFAPLFEELSFRGLMFPALMTQIRKPWVAMLLCGLVFAAIHPQGPLMWPALATTGAAAAALRYYTGSLVPSIVLHMVHNALILAVTSVMG